MGKRPQGGEDAPRVVVVLGDQLDAAAPWTRIARKDRDLIWMAEVREESTHVWSHRQRIAVFLSAMRHFRDRLREGGWTVAYRELGDGSERGESLGEQLAGFLEHHPEIGEVVLVRPGEWRVLKDIEEVVQRARVEFQLLEDTHFFTTPDDFAKHAEGRKSLRMEFFYREVRRREKVLLTAEGKPEGGKWNFDADNRKSFGKKGPESLPPLRRCEPDALTQEVLREVERGFPDHPGSLKSFAWPVTADDAEGVLRDFVQHRLPGFGDFQDAMWEGEAFLYHSLLSVALNLKLIHPRRVVEAAEEAYREGRAPLSAVEGFIRQILGWREYVRGVYWHFMPEYVDRNHLGAKRKLPEFYWTGDCEMNCLRSCVGQTLEHGYAHHIQRLMVTGLYALLTDIDPREVHQWYLAVYVDAVEWVELPNTLGMSQFADGGVMASKPYVATGKYIDRMSNYCRGCRFNPGEATGDQACPFTTLYWDFLMRHEERLRGNPRMTMQLRNLARLSNPRRTTIREKARSLLS